MKILTQISQRITLILLFAIFSQNIYADDITTAQEGDWTNGLTWNSGSVPTAADNVIISHQVTVSSVVTNTVQNITITTASVAELLFTNTGTLTGTGNFFTEKRLSTNGTWVGTFNVEGDFVLGNGAEVSLLGTGIINAGNSIDDMFKMLSGAILNWNDDVVINVAGYAHLEGGILKISKPITMNISTAGTRNDANDNKKILQAVVFDFKTSSDKIDFVIKNFNTGSGIESYTEDFLTTGGGSVGVKFENSEGATGYILEINTNHTIMPTIYSDIGVGNTLFIESISGSPLTTSIPSIAIASGSFNLSWWIDMTVTNDFNSSSSEVLTIDGIIHVSDTLTLNASSSINNIIGDGQVSATTYSLGSNLVFGVTPLDGNKSAGANWIGDDNADWNDEDNWSQKLPTQNTMVYISNLYLYPSNNLPLISMANGEAREIELEGSGLSLTVTSQKTLLVGEQGSSGQGGVVSIGSGTSFLVDGGEAVIETNLVVGAASVTVENGGRLLIDNDFTVGDGATVTIGVGASVTAGTVTNAASTVGDGLIIKSTSAGSGSLISTGTPTATVERFIEYGESSGRWNMVTPSTTGVSGQTFYDADLSSDSWLTYYDEAIGTDGGADGLGWEYLTTLTDAVNVGQGYSYWPSVDETVSFKGEIRTTNFGPTITWTDSDHGYNLIGNPFSSALLWDGTWTMPNVNNAIWIWNGSQYESTPGGLETHNIPVGQGFFVRANAASPSITIPTAKRLHSTQAFLKSSQENKDNEFKHLIINAQNNQYQDRVFIYFDETGTDAYDDGFDAEKMFGLAEAPQLYLVENELNQTYDFLPTIEEGEERTVAMSYIAGAVGEQKLIADFTYFTGADVTLEDLKTGNIQNLNENNVYSFTGSKDDSAERFLLHFAWSPDGIGDDIENTSSNINIYAYGKDIYIHSMDDAISQSGEVFVYDLMGRDLVKQQIANGELIKLNVNATNNYVVVKVVKDGFSKTEKVFIK